MGLAACGALRRGGQRRPPASDACPAGPLLPSTGVASAAHRGVGHSLSLQQPVHAGAVQKRACSHAEGREAGRGTSAVRRPQLACSARLLQATTNSSAAALARTRQHKAGAHQGRGEGNAPRVGCSQAEGVRVMCG